MARHLPFVLVYAADMHGCGWHRIISPAQSLMSAGLAYARLSGTMISPDELAACPPDTIVFQRQIEDGQLEYIENVRAKLPNTRFIYEIDDLLSNVDEQNYHQSFLGPPEEMNRRIGKALSFCDGATVPTEPLKHWLESLAPDLPIKIVPNYLPELDHDLPPIKTRAKLRVGWYGGISHGGDLEQIKDAVIDLATSRKDIQFVFMGMRPPGVPEDLYEFVEGVPPAEFAKKLKTLELDLILAPLIETPFNNAKSVLRLAQAGMIGAATLASFVGQYRTSHVWRYAEENGWKAAIEEFANLSGGEQMKAKTAQREWAMSFSAAQNAKKIAHGWQVPVHDEITHRLRPKYLVTGGAKAIEVAGVNHGLALVDGPDNIIEAYDLAKKDGLGLLIARPKTFASKSVISRLLTDLASRKDASSVSTFSNDGKDGVWLLQRGNFVQSSPEVGDKVAQTLAQLPMSHKTVDAPYPYGPLAILSPRAVARVTGWPKVGNITECLREWGSVAGPAHIFSLTNWVTSMVPEGPNIAGTKGIPDLRDAQFNTKEMNIFRMEYELAHGRIHHTTPVPAGNLSQQLDTWTSFYAGVHENEAEPLKAVARVNIGDNDALGTAFNDPDVHWIRFDFPECQFPDEAVSLMQQFGTETPDSVDVIYCDWLALDPDGKLGAQPVFLPDRPDFYHGLGRDIWSATAIFRKSALSELPVPKTRNDIWLLASEYVLEGKSSHFPRLISVATENRAADERTALIAKTWPEFKTTKVAEFGFLKLSGAVKHKAKVSVIIPTTGDPWLLRPCLATLAKNTGYSGEIEVVLVISGSDGDHAESLGKIKSFEDSKNATIVRTQGPFNFSKACNVGVQNCTSDFIVFANDDIRFANEGWLDSLLTFAERQDVAWVSPRLVKQDGKLQICGTYAGEGTAVEMFKGLGSNELGYGALSILTHQTGAPVGALAVIERSKFTPFREDFPYNYNDVLAGYDARKRGLVNIVDASVDILHNESATRGKAKQDVAYQRLLEDKVKLVTEMPDEDETYPSALKIEAICHGIFVAGGNMDLLKWDTTLPDNAERVLVIGRDMKQIAEEVRNAGRTFVAIVSTDEGKPKLKIVSPMITSLFAGIPLDDTATIRHIIGRLGINRIRLAPSKDEETVLPDVVEGWIR